MNRRKKSVNQKTSWDAEFKGKVKKALICGAMSSEDEAVENDGADVFHVQRYRWRSQSFEPVWTKNTNKPAGRKLRSKLLNGRLVEYRTTSILTI